MYNIKERLQKNSNLKDLLNIKNNNIQRSVIPVTYDVRIQRKHQIVQKEVIQRKLYNRGKPVENVRQLNDYLITICSVQPISYSDFKNVPENEVDAAIQLLSDEDNIYEDAIGVISGKIEEMHQNSDAEIRAEIEKIEKILQKKWVQTREFIGDSSMWHIHIVGKEKHLKYGKDKGSRISLNNERNMIMAAMYLIKKDGLTCDSGQQCFNWLICAIINEGNTSLPDDLLTEIRKYLSQMGV